MNYSNWNCIDLHIHSEKSNDVKKNDYDGEKVNAVSLLDKLILEGVSIFSITDHNCINNNLYKDIEKNINNIPYKGVINYIIGVELDIKDLNIYEKVFHCLCFFETQNIDNIETAINDLFDNKNLSERNEEKNYPDIQKLFNSLFKNKIKNILLIPHFNRKGKGLPSDIAIEHLNHLCFNAYEDSNNIDNIRKSLNIYLKAGFENFPFVIFTDNHNLKKYPMSKNGGKCTKCYMLSNIKFPFNSVKTAFEEPRLRISINGVKNMRNTNISEKYIKSLDINGTKLYLSPYQNTIIGKFGSGKSLLLEKIKNGNKGLKNSDMYKSLYNEDEKFKIEITNQNVDSLSETLASTKNIVKYEFIQQEKYYYKNSLTQEEAKNLFSQLNINYEFGQLEKFEFNEEDLNSSFESIELCIEKSNVKNNLNYDRAFDEQEYYSINYISKKDNIKETKIKLDSKLNDLLDLKDLKIYDDIFIFNNNEINQIKNMDRIFNKKTALLNFISQSNFMNKIKDMIDSYSYKYVNNDEKMSINTFNSDIKDLCANLLNFRKQCNIFEKVLTEKKYNKLIEPKKESIFSKYSIQSEFRDVEEYKSVIKLVIKDENRTKKLFTSILKTLNLNGDFLGKKTFSYNIKKYIDYVNNLFNVDNLTYDLLLEEKSMLKRSAGEKSSLFISLLFSLIEKDLEKEENVILLLDQPEDNIDNENIFNEISENLKKIKLKNKNFQSIIVTHNANVGISSDSENIIIAKEKIDEFGKKSFTYDSGCIENPIYIDEVCNILEGGKKAMEQRTVKYGINIIKKVTCDEI